MNHVHVAIPVSAGKDVPVGAGRRIGEHVEKRTDTGGRAGTTRALAVALVTALTIALSGCGKGTPGAQKLPASTVGSSADASTPQQAAAPGTAQAAAPGTAQVAAAGTAQAAARSAPQGGTPDPMLVDATGDIAKRLVIAPLATSTIAETIRIAGKLDVNQYRTSRIGAPFTGRLVQVDALFGEQVKQGQVLAEINSPDLAQAQLAFLRAHAQQQLNSRAVDRARLLLASDVIGSAELQRRESELTVAIAEKRAASDQLKSLGMTSARIATLERTGQIQATAPITSPLNGTVIERKVAQGQVVNPTDVLFLVSDLSTLWALAEVPEQDAQYVRKGQPVAVEIPALENSRVKGTVAFVADVVDPQTRTVRVSVVLQNPERRLKPSMLITMLIEGRNSAQQVVPSTAVVRENDRDHLFVARGRGQFRLVPVDLGLERDGKRPVLKPFNEPVNIVADGAFHLNNVRAQRAVDGAQR